MDRFLLISPHFPPSAKIGAKRALNIVRHLPALGWEPVVVSCPVRRGSEELGQRGLVPDATVVYREFTSRIGRALRGSGDSVERIPEIIEAKAPPPPPRFPLLNVFRNSDLTPLDQYMWDVPFVTRNVEGIARREGVRAIVVNADPWSGLVVGAAAARRLDLPLIADLRDPWALHPRRQPRRPAPTRALVSRLERRLLLQADRIVLNTEQCAAAYRDHYAGVIEPERFSWVRNAFDASIYHPGTVGASAGFAVHYFGTVGSGRDPSSFYAGFAQFVREQQLGARDARVIFYGDAHPSADPRVRDLGLTEFIETRAPSLLRDSLRQLRAADVLLLLEGPERSLQLPAKLYDYLAARRPILAVGAHDELSDILARTRAGVSTRCDQGPDAVARHLADLYRGRNRRFEPDDKAIDEFTAEAQAMRFQHLLDDVVRGAASR